MIWPFVSRVALLASERLAEVQQAAAVARAADLEAQVAYWRARYERLADARLFATGDIRVPVHEEPKARTNPRQDTIQGVVAALAVDEIDSSRRRTG